MSNISNGAHARLHEFQQEIGGEFMGFGPPSEGGVRIVADFGRYEAEYAAIRQRVGIAHMPQRAVLRLSGADRADFLHRMLSCNVQALGGGGTRRAFQLDPRGRIIADLMLHHGEADTWLETDVMDIENLRQLFEGRLFGEDMQIEDFRDQRTKLVMHGPGAFALLESVADDPEGVRRLVNMAGTHHVIHIGDVAVSAYRHDDTGSVGLHLLVPAAQGLGIYRTLLDAAGFDAAAESEPGPGYARQRRESLRGRPIGWLAYNTARIEAGTAVFHVDFGNDSLPAETGAMDEAVDMDKGCYLGQEVVARMQSRGHPRRVLVGVRLDGARLPMAGATVLSAEGDESDAGGEVIGAVTSSTLSPLLGQTAIAFAVVQWGQHHPGTRVRIPTEEGTAQGHVHALRFISGT